MKNTIIKKSMIITIAIQVIVCQAIFSQTLIIDKGIVLKKGIYRNYR